MLAVFFGATNGLMIDHATLGIAGLSPACTVSPNHHFARGAVACMSADADEKMPALRRPDFTAAEMSAEMDELTENSSQVRRLQPKSPLWRKAPPGREDIDEERGWGDRKKSNA